VRVWPTTTLLASASKGQSPLRHPATILASMPERFVQFRLSLLIREQLSAFDQDLNRERYIRQVFAEEHVFEHYGSNYYYRPSEEQPQESVVFGLVGREVIVEENLPPEEGFTEWKHPAWKASVVVVDPVDHTDGQRVAMELDMQVGNPLKLFASLVDRINGVHQQAPFTIEVQPIVDTSSFWAWAERNRGNVTAVRFQFVPPNGMWSASSNIAEELRGIRNESNAEQVGVALTSDEGLNTDSPPVQEAVDYIDKSGGKITGAARGGRRFSSTNAPQVETMPKDQDQARPLIERVVERIAAVFGRE
jgi:hypothetical protein